MTQQLLLPENESSFEVNNNLSPLELICLIRKQLPKHLISLGLSDSNLNYSKDLIRASHASQRAEYFEKERKFIELNSRKLLYNFANGNEVNPSKIDPYICPVSSNTEDSALFRLATLLWSVPVSRGYGRRMRFLIRDRSNGKLIGLFALTDPVFNLKPRDQWIGWNADDRRSRLVNVMDAHVVGSVPPYSTLLGGKIVATLMTSQEVCEAFSQKYEQRVGIISKEQKNVQLLLLTVTSALGRSSLYNRLRLENVMSFEKIGMTNGWGHFHIPQSLFQLMRELLTSLEHPYAKNHQFGQGPNWRIRVIRKSLEIVGLDENILKHGIQREIYGIPMVDGWREYLQGDNNFIPIPHRPSMSELAQLAINRWLIPRSHLRTEYRLWTRENTYALLNHHEVYSSSLRGN